MTEDEILSELETEFKDKIPDLSILENQENLDALQQVLLNFILPFQKEELFIYMSSREDNKCIAQHIAEIPQGIGYFEDWFNQGLLNFATNILNTLQSTIAKDKVYLSFAHLLDSKDLDLFFKKSKFKKDEEQQLSNMLSDFLAEPELDLFLQALSCIYVGLNNSAKSLLKLWIQALWLDGADIQKTIDKAKAIATIKEHSSKAGKAGAQKRWSPKELTKKYAIDSMLKGTYKNPSRAADAISESVILYGRTAGFNFSSTFQAQKTIYDWLRTYKNQLPKSEAT
jgi:hypothetical protein